MYLPDSVAIHYQLLQSAYDAQHATLESLPSMIRPIAVLALAALLLAACSRITPDNYAKLEAGMTREEVHRILGPADEVSGGGIGKLTISTESWSGPKHVITVTFAGDQLTLKRIEPRSGQ